MARSARKPDAGAIREFLLDLARQDWLSGRRGWWPKYVFHHTDILNAAKILQDGRLLSRRLVETSGGLLVDGGSVDVLQSTASWVADWVRLYFRPRTPTQYRCEGVRPADQIQLQAHCPVPVFFLFDSLEVLTLAESSFSEGNLAANADTGSDVEFLRRLDFHKIYHTGWFDPADHSITFSRNAEVFVKDSLGLQGLKWIVTRTEAERETLLSLLSAPTQGTWLDRIRVDTNLQLFERRWTFIEQVLLDPSLATFRFSPDTQGPGPFAFHIDVNELGAGTSYVYHNETFQSRPVFRLSFPNELASYRLTATLDNHLVYQGDRFDEPPF